MSEGYNLLEQGERLLAENRLDEAIERFRRYLDDYPEDAEGQYQLGIALYERGELDEAVLRFERVRSLSPDDPRGYDGLALVMMERGDYRAAVELYRRALEMDPDNVDFLNELGIAHHELGEEDEADERAGFGRAGHGGEVGLGTPEDLLEAVQVAPGGDRGLATQRLHALAVLRDGGAHLVQVTREDGIGPARFGLVGARVEQHLLQEVVGDQGVPHDE